MVDWMAGSMAGFVAGSMALAKDGGSLDSMAGLDGLWRA